ncbi:MAG: hypothetical protein ABFE02_00330 [Sulfuricella sp.]
MEIITPPVAGTRFFDDTFFAQSYPTSHLSFALEVPSEALDAEALGSAKVYIETFRSDLDDTAFGSNKVSIEFDTQDVDNKFNSYWGPWQVYSDNYDQRWSTARYPLRPGSLEIERSTEHVRWSANGAVFIDYTPPIILPPARKITFGVSTRAVGAENWGNVSATPMFSGAIRLYVEPYVNPSAFWTGLVGTKETV